MIGRALAIGVAIIALVAALAWFGPAACERIAGRGAQEKLDQSQIEALGSSANEAIAIQGEAAKREAASDDLTRSNEKEIRNAEGAKDAVNPAVRDAGLRSLCRRATYRDSERCRVFRAGAR